MIFKQFEYHGFALPSVNVILIAVRLKDDPSCFPSVQDKINLPLYQNGDYRESFRKCLL